MTASAAAGLGAGSYLWNSSLAPDGPMNMVIDLRTQRAFVYRDGVLVGVSTISSGKPGYETPDGAFTVLEKQRVHHSNKYDNAPMPYMQRLSWSGLALHGGHPRGYPASHGCIRLPMGFAAALFKQETSGMDVVITGHAPGRDEIRMAGRHNRSHEIVQDTDFLAGQGDLNAPPVVARPAVQSGLAKGAGDQESDDQSNDGANKGDLDHQTDQLQNDEHNNGQYHGQDDLDRSQGIPPQDLPPPPG